MKNKFLITVAALLLTATTQSAYARDQIRIVGSSTVFPFATVAAESFGKKTDFKTPVIESTGTGGGMKLFCAGVGTEHPDLTNASRAIKKGEVENCKANGVTPIEIKIGFDGIVIANSNKGEKLSLTLKDVFLALAKVIPDGKGGLIPNPNKTWKDVRADLPNQRIEVLGPPPTSGTRDAFVEIAMEGGAKAFKELKELRKSDKKKFKAVAHGIREDGAFIEAGENDNLIVQKLTSNPNAFGVFGFSFLDANNDKIQGATVEGAQPTFENIASGKYKVSRSLFFYVKKEHVGVIPGIKEYVQWFASDAVIGDEGAAIDKGLIPLPVAERVKLKSVVDAL
jgi:phosphate transport system substrate-binding protein